MFHKNTLVPGDGYCSVKSFCPRSIKRGEGVTPMDVEKRKNAVSQEPVQNEEGESFAGRRPRGLLRSRRHHGEREGDRLAPGFHPACMGQNAVAGNSLGEYEK